MRVDGWVLVIDPISHGQQHEVQPARGVPGVVLPAHRREESRENVSMRHSLRVCMCVVLTAASRAAKRPRWIHRRKEHVIRAPTPEGEFRGVDGRIGGGLGEAPQKDE